jgi:hypothetical protein
LILSDLQRFLAAQNTKLFAFAIDDAQLGCPNLLIQAGVFGYNLSPLIIIGLGVLGILTDDTPEVNDYWLRPGILAAVGQGFADMGRGDGRGVLQVGNGSGDFDGPHVSPGRDIQAGSGAIE